MASLFSSARVIFVALLSSEAELGGEVDQVATSAASADSSSSSSRLAFSVAVVVVSAVCRWALAGSAFSRGERGQR
jgi:hypothetical protein